ncbi:MAG: zinc ribbon domain-containing protein [Chloroflexi bacterium]|nr:MAG: zinc ribbon domain-containing protein [Chloroflexota bacterium]
MPLYEYVCARCETRFEQLRPAGRMDDPASCPSGHGEGRRVLSTFAAMTRSEIGEPASITGGGCSSGCTNCACSLN